MLTDSHHRIHNYLRISLTDKCNFRCVYCMPNEEMQFMPSEKHMSVQEIYSLAEIFVSMGVDKIRLTGGEPLMRKDFAQIIESLAKLPVELTFTSNGVLIDQYIDTILACRIKGVNISLDSLNENRFKNITARDAFQKVMNNIELLLNSNLHVKINVVLMKGKNDDELIDFIRWTKHSPIHVRFIEYMPFDGNRWNADKVVTYGEIIETIEKYFSVEKLQDEKHNTAKAYTVNGFAGTFAVISTMSQPFCSTCNRLRITADGKMKNCLFSKGETDLLTNLRNGMDIKLLIQQNLYMKKEKLGGQLHNNYTKTNVSDLKNRSMIQIGG